MSAVSLDRRRQTIVVLVVLCGLAVALAFRQVAHANRLAPPDPIPAGPSRVEASDTTGNAVTGDDLGHAARLALYKRRVADLRPLEARLWGPATSADVGRAVAGVRRAPHRAAPMTPAALRMALGQTDAECLAQAVYYEARGEPSEGQAAVAQVVMNRVRSPFYPKSACKVVFQGAERPGCQFSFACNGAMHRGARDSAAWSRARLVADQTLAQAGVAPQVGPALNYHADYVHPSWARRLLRVASIGRHIFYQVLGNSPPPGGAVPLATPSDAPAPSTAGDTG